MGTNNGRSETNDDPAPEASELPRDRINAAIHQIAGITLDQLRELRDECDNLMRAIADHRDNLIGSIAGFASLATATVKTKNIMGDAMRKLSDDFETQVINAIPLPSISHEPPLITPPARSIPPGVPTRNS